jgi:cytochrome c553
MSPRLHAFAIARVAAGSVRAALVIAGGGPGAGVLALAFMAVVGTTVASAQNLEATTGAEAPGCAGVPLAASPGTESPLVDPAKDLRAAIAAGSGDRDWGEWLAGECLACHGLHAKAEASIPPLATLDPMAFASALEEYRRHLRPDPGMRLLASRLAPDEVAALAAYFASLPGEDAADAVPADNR